MSHQPYSPRIQNPYTHHAKAQGVLPTAFSAPGPASTELVSPKMASDLKDELSMRTRIVETQRRLEALEEERRVYGEKLAELEAKNSEFRARLSKHRKNVVQEGPEDRPLTKSDLTLDVCCFLSDVNTQLRCQIGQLFLQKTELAFELTALPKQDRARLEKEISSVFEHPITQGTEKSFQNCDRDPKELHDLWRKLHENTTLRGLYDVFGDTTEEHRNEANDCSSILRALEVNMQLYEDAKTNKFTDGPSVSADSDAKMNYGFSHSLSVDYVYEFDEEDNESNIWIREDNTGAQRIHAATIGKLVERVTHEEHNDLNTRYVFLLTHMSFTTSTELLGHLQRRYYVPVPPNMSPTELNLFKQKKLARIQIKVFSVLKNWIEEHWDEDFAKNSDLVSGLKTWMKQLQKENGGPWSKNASKRLLELIRQKEDGGEKSTRFDPDCPRPIIKAGLTLDTIDFLELSDKEVARQLTIRDFEVFQNIQPRECLNKNWSGSNKDTAAPNIVAMIEGFNKLCSWVQLEILGQENMSRRSKMLTKFIKIAEHCEAFNNFNSLYAIFCGLIANPIHRLKKTREELRTNILQKFEHIKALCSVESNYKNLRAVLKTALTPCIPHLGIFLADLTFIEDGNEGVLKGMINFSKRRKMAERIMWIKQYQQASYQLKRVEAIQKYFAEHMTLMDEDTLWDMSLKVEPRDS